MASFFSSVRQNFGRGTNKAGSNKGNGSPVTSPTSNQSSTNLSAPSGSQTPHSPSMNATMALDNPPPQENLPPPTGRKPPFFFREEYAGLIAKGNFHTLAARPKLVDEGEWLAHQAVSQFSLLAPLMQTIQAVDDRTGLPLCNPECCPTMSVYGHIYTWLDTNKQPLRIPAQQYIHMVTKWIIGKISDPVLFPTDNSANAYASGGLNTPGSATPIPAGPTSLNTSVSSLAGREWAGKASGFPEKFESEVRSIYRQMMRIYAHIYHGHWIEPFWHLDTYKELNTCFIHFVNVGRSLNLLNEKDMEPMQPLIDIWLANGMLQPVAPASTQSPQQAQQPKR